MYKALLVGCGNIGALYDLESDRILTHAKAFHVNDRFTFSVFDVDKQLAGKVGEKYNCEVIEKVDEKTFASFDCVSICTPTGTHYEFLQNALYNKVKLVICEKPVSNNAGELNALQELYNKSNTKIIVNYIRRFQPSFIALKEFLSDIIEKETVTNIAVRYQRGFLNNCGHALDIIEFLLGYKLDLQEIKLSNKAYDQFPDDPTLSLQAKHHKTNIVITGLSDIKFSFFEIDIYFEYHYISIKNAGATIRIYKAQKDERRFMPLQLLDDYSQDDCLKDYMKYVIDDAYKLLSGEQATDNFSSSVDMNIRMLTYINQ